ncbi:MAG: hypothetical protein WB562_10670 [Candidatus Sulfotelmatobacter sp.]
MDLSYVHLVNQGGYSQINTGTALASSASAADISPGGSTLGQAFTFPADSLQPGQQYRVRSKGIVSNTGTPNLTLGVYYGGVAGTALCTTGALATVTSLSNNLWTLEADIRVSGTVGTSGSIYALGSVAGPFASTAFMPATSSSGNLVASLDTSVAKILTVGATWGTSSASNSIQVILFTVERLDEGAS